MHDHHIIPKHMGGTNDPSNIVSLTVEEHAEAHKILYEKYGLLEDKLAWMGLLGLISKEEIVREIQVETGRRLVEWNKLNRKYGPLSVKHRENISKGMSGKILSPEHIKNISLGRIGISPWNKGKCQSPLEKEQIKKERARKRKERLQNDPEWAAVVRKKDRERKRVKRNENTMNSA